MSVFRTTRISNPRFEQDQLRIATVKSKVLGGRGDLSFYVPANCPGNASLVILLHGVYGSHWSWSMGGGAHLTAERLIQQGEIDPLVLAMPSDGLWGDGSGYLPHQARNYERWIVDEVPAAATELIEGVTGKSAVFIAGLSMGGYGALRLGGAYANRFAGISAHSAITRFEQLAKYVEEPLADFETDTTVLNVVDALLENKEMLPPLRFDCGSEDPLLTANRLLHSQLQDAGVKHQYEEFGGGHEWPYWEQHLEDTLRFFNQIEKDF